MIFAPRTLIDGHKDELQITELVAVDAPTPADLEAYSCEVRIPMGNHPQTGKPVVAARRFSFKADNPAHAFEVARSMRDAESLRLRTDIRAKQARDSLVLATALPSR